MLERISKGRKWGIPTDFLPHYPLQCELCPPSRKQGERQTLTPGRCRLGRKTSAVLVWGRSVEVDELIYNLNALKLPPLSRSLLYWKWPSIPVSVKWLSHVAMQLGAKDELWSSHSCSSWPYVFKTICCWSCLVTLHVLIPFLATQQG